MANITKLIDLPEPHIMMWDAGGEIIYPILIGERHKSKMPPQNKWRLVYSINSTNWIEESEYIREISISEYIKHRSIIDRLILKYRERAK